MKAIIRWAILAASLSSTVLAQSPRQLSNLIKTLPDQEQAVVTKLGEVNHLPGGAWRVHPGDIAHAEDPILDDSSWPVATTGEGYSGDAVWFRQWIEIPRVLHGYDLTGARIWFTFGEKTIGSLGTEIVYFDGRRVAMGEDLEPIVLSASAKPGEKILVAVKVVALTGPKYHTGTTLRIDFPQGRPDPEIIRNEIMSASVLLPSLSNHLQQDSAILANAVSAVNLQALEDGNQQLFDESLRESQAKLDELGPLMQRATFHLTGQSHIDVAWRWPWTETVDVVRRTFSTALQLMHEYPDYTFSQSTAVYNEWMAEKYPALDDEIKKRIKEGRWEIVGGMWVEPDLNMPDGESIARSLLIGKRWYQQHYGVNVRVGWNPDSFGYNWQLPQIYKKSGIDYFVTQKMSWNETHKLPLQLFWWESPDGSKVLTYFPPGFDKALDPVDLSLNMKQSRKRAPGSAELLDLYGVGDHGGGPTRALLDAGEHWMQPGTILPKMKFGTAQAFFSDVEKKIAPESPTWNYKSIAQGDPATQEPVSGQIAIPTWNDELYLETHRGVFTSQAQEKRNLRETSEEALDAEKYASFAWLNGGNYPGQELTEAWKKITFNDFHDIAPGSAIADVYRDAERDYDQVRLATNEIKTHALQIVAESIDTRVAEGVPVLVFNTLGWQRSGIIDLNVQLPEDAQNVSVLDGDGRVLPSELIAQDSTVHKLRLLVKVNDLPAMGYKVLHVVPEKRAFDSDLHVTGTTLENEKLRVVVDPKTGCISSLYDKESDRETIAAGSCGNELQAFNDRPRAHDAWDIDAGTLDQVPEKLHADAVQVVERGAMRGVVRVTRSWRNSKFIEEIILYTGSDQVIVETDIDWHERHTLLKTAFALSATAPFATYEIPFGTIQRPTTRENSWTKAQFEVPALNWADLGDEQHGFSLINESKYGYDAVGNVLRLSLLRSPTDPDPNTDQGHHHFSYALYPHAGDWKKALTVRHGYEFNYRLEAVQVEPHSGTMPSRHSFASVSPEDVVLTAIKKAEDSSGLIFHMYEWAGKEGVISLGIPQGATAAVETDLLEQPEGSPLTLSGDKVEVPVHPFEILSVRVDYPQAVSLPVQ